MTLNNYLTNIADAVRTKKGSSKKLPLTSIAEEIESIGANNANIAELPNMGGSYTNAYIMDYIRDIDAGGWDVTNLESFPKFGDANSKLETIKFKGIKGTEKVTSLNGIFSNLSKLTSIDFSDFDTSKCTNMYRMFYECSSLTSLDLSKFDTSSCMSMYYMFYECSKLSSITLGADWASNSSITAFDLSACPLTHDSCLDVFNKLATKTSSATLTLSSTTKALMSEDEIKIATDKGWTVS